MVNVSVDSQFNLLEPHFMFPFCIISESSKLLIFIMSYCYV